MEPLVADVVIVILRNIQLEEASVRLGERCLAQAWHQPYFVLVREVCQVYGQASATPDELQVQLAFFLREAGFKDTPEHGHDTMVFATAWIRRDRLEGLNVKSLLTTGTDLDLVPLHEVENR